MAMHDEAQRAEALTRAWNEAMETEADAARPPRRKRRLLGDRAPRTRAVVLATGLLVVGISPFAVAKTGDALREGARNGTTTSETEIISNVGSTTALKGGYSTRQSNLSSSGGGAIYGCRSQAGGSAAKPRPQNPCLRANNLSRGYAFEFNSANGDVAGLFSVGAGGDSKKPFVTNATGVATGLNADRVDNLNATQLVGLARTKTGLDADTVDGRDAADLSARFAQVSAAGTLGSSRGLAGTGGLTHVAASGVYTLVFSADLSACSVSATLTDPAGGEIAATPATAGGSTTIVVRTATSAGAPADRAFHVQASC